MKKKLIVTLCAVIPVAALAAFLCRRNRHDYMEQ